MKFRVERDALADAVAWTAKSLPSRPSVPVLAGVMLRVATAALTVSGFDYEVSSQVDVEVQADADGAALVSGRLLAEITKALPAKPVEIAAVGAHLELVCGSARFTLPTMPVEDYPTLPEMPASRRPRRRRRLRRGGGPGRHRGRPRRDAADDDRRPAGDRRATRWPCSPPTATGSPSARSPGPRTTPDDQRHRARAGAHPGRHRQDARPDRRRRHRRARRRRQGRGHDRLRRRRPAGPPAGCSTADYPQVRALFPPSYTSEARVTVSALSRSSSASRWSPSAHPGAAELQRGRSRGRGRRHRGGAGQRGDGRRLHRRADDDRVQPAVPARGPRRARRADRGVLVHRPDQARSDHPRRRRRCGDPRVSAT